MRAFAATISILMLMGHHGYAIETPDVLPKGIRSLSVKMGNVGGLNQYYSDSGKLYTVGDLNTVSLDVAALTALDDSVTELVNILNQFGPDNLGDQLFLGNLSVNAQPDLEYLAPVFLYGMSDRLTLGLGVPFFTFDSNASVNLTNSNFDDLRAEFAGATEDLDAAFEQLNLDMRSEFNDQLTQKGYKPIESRSESFVGDIQLLAAYQLASKNKKQVQAAQIYLNLPTGPEDDPDDLTDIEIFGHTSIRPAYVTAYSLSPRATLLGSLSYQYILPRKINRRVPLDEDDRIPEKDQTRNLEEKIGDTWSASAGVSWKHTSSFTTSLAYAREEKAADSYSQSDIGDSSLLERETKRTADIGKIELFYSSVEQYKQKKAAIPYTLAFEISSVLSGTNIENQTRHELWLSLYF